LKIGWDNHVGQLGSAADIEIRGVVESMSHHYSGPDFGFPRGDARLDLTDLYAFPKPGDPRKSILIMNVHSVCFRESAGTNHHEPFAPRGYTSQD